MGNLTHDNETSSTVEQLETKFSTPEAQLTDALQLGDDLDAKVVRKLIRKIDLRIMPALGMLYAVSLIDRVNLSVARIAGMDDDLQLSVGDSVVTIGMGFTNTWGQLLACRAIFGALEGGLFPGCIFLLSCWYTRFEIQKRFSGFYCLGMLASGFSSILAYGIQKMKGVGGLNGWRWIFILEGIITCVVAIIGFLLLIDFPDKASQPGLIRKSGFLTTREASIILARIQRDRGDAIAEKLTLWRQLRHLSDWKVWEMAILLLCNWMFSSAYVGDKFHIRGPLIVFSACFTITGVAMMGFCTSNASRYAGVFLAVASSNANIPALFSYQHNNTVGQAKRSVSSAMMIAGGGLGGLISGLVFRQQDAPQYKPGLLVVLSLQALTVVIVTKNFWYFARQNRKADRGDLVIEGQEGFRYTY
ncbi:hypothetical protein V502_05446 [Pseudogymnoascus sp. VKM F-4520 (FW-2644)]|nr:hypothetical protein V502_05446 [Pseudogymnoascus sp. VKM F-4520 (FW-2644)]